MQRNDYVLIDSHVGAFDLRLGELWRYRELVWLLTRRSFVVTYKQTILGPLWLVVSPLLTSMAYVILFGRIAGLSTEGVPQLLFYLLGTAAWTCFAACVGRCATTFVDNAGVFSKVWFPRLAAPVSTVLGAFVRLAIQLVLVLVLIAWYAVHGVVAPRWELWPLVPLAVLQLGLLGMGCGIVVSSATTRYRDLAVLVDFGVTLWMYATPVVYPLSQVPDALRAIVLANPATAPVEWLRMALLGVGGVPVAALAWSWAVTLAVVLLGVAVFNRVERTFVDTV
ncbi:MAG: ABC transporter permease [Atopobiaceae bacterium]|nr:ABC transporter permease [Atopobiaceae bacterium]